MTFALNAIALRVFFYNYWHKPYTWVCLVREIRSFTMWSYLYIMIICRMTSNMWLCVLAISTKTEGINWCIIECFVVLNLMLACQYVMWYVCLINKISTNMKCPKYHQMDWDLCTKMNSCQFTHWELDFLRDTWKLLWCVCEMNACMDDFVCFNFKIP